MKKVTKKLLVDFIHATSKRVSGKAIPKTKLNTFSEEELKEIIYSDESLKEALEIFCCETDKERQVYSPPYEEKFEFLITAFEAHSTDIFLITEFRLCINDLPYGLFSFEQLLSYFDRVVKIQPNGHLVATTFLDYQLTQEKIFKKYSK